MPFEFRKFLWASVAIHVAAFLFFYFAPSFRLPHKDTKITMVRLSKGTGEKPSPNAMKKAKGMPESTLREQKKVKEVTKDKKGSDQKSKPSPIKKKPQQPQIAKDKATPKGGLNPKPKPQTQEDKTIEDALARVQEQLQQRDVQLEAAQIEKEGDGQSMAGSLEPGTEINPALLAYYTELKRKINEQWITLPKTEGQTLKTIINVMIDTMGNIVSTAYEAKSGDVSFDLSAMRAIERAAPFPSPPEEIKQEAVSEGFLIEFSPRSVVGGL